MCDAMEEISVKFDDVQNGVFQKGVTTFYDFELQKFKSFEKYKCQKDYRNGSEVMFVCANEWGFQGLNVSING